MTTCTSAPISRRRRTKSGHLYTAMPPVTPSRTCFLDKEVTGCACSFIHELFDTVSGLLDGRAMTGFGILFAIHVTFLEAYDAVVEAHAESLTGDVVRRHRSAAMFRVEAVYEALRAVDEGVWIIDIAAELLPVSGMQVFDHVHAVLGHPGIEEIEGLVNILHEMAAVIQHHVWRAELVDQTLQELDVALVTNAHENAGLFVLLAALLDVDPDDFRHGAEVALPHLQRS